MSTAEQYVLNLSIATENFEAKAGQLYSFPATPGKQCLRPKVSLGGCGIVLLSILHGYSCPATPGKQCLPPKCL